MEHGDVQIALSGNGVDTIVITKKYSERNRMRSEDKTNIPALL